MIKPIIYLVVWVLRSSESANITIDGITYPHSHEVLITHDSAFKSLCEAKAYWETLEFNQPNYQFRISPRVKEAYIYEISKESENTFITASVQKYEDKPYTGIIRITK